MQDDQDTIEDKAWQIAIAILVIGFATCVVLGLFMDVLHV